MRICCADVITCQCFCPVRGSCTVGCVVFLLLLLSAAHSAAAVCFLLCKYKPAASFSKNTLILLQEPNDESDPRGVMNIRNNLLQCWKDVITDDTYSWWSDGAARLRAEQTAGLFYGSAPCVLWQLLPHCFITVVGPLGVMLSEWLITHSHGNNHNSICALALISPFYISGKQVESQQRVLLRGHMKTSVL